MQRTLPSWLRWCLAATVTMGVTVLPAAHVSRAASTITLTMECPNGTFWPAISETVIKAYTKLHPNVHVQLTQVDSSTYNQKLQIQAAAGTLPDIVVTSDGDNLQFALHGIALNMQPFVDKDPGYNIMDIYQNFLDLGRVAGQSGLYMIPFSADAVVTYYNKNMFKAAGVPLPQPNWTYAQFLSAAEKLTKTDSSGKVTQWGVDFGNAIWWATSIPWMVGFGGTLLTHDGKHTNLSSPGSIAGWQAIQDLYTKYKVAVPVTNPLAGSAFYSGHAAMTFTVHAAVSGIEAAVGNKFAWDVQEMPSFPNGKHVDGMGTAGYTITADSKQQAAAWDLVSFVGSVQGQTALARTGATMPIRKSMLNSPVWRIKGINNAAYLEAIKYGMTPPQLTPNTVALNCGTVYTGLMSTTLGNVFDKIVRGASPASVLKAADQTINNCIASQG